MNDGLRRIPIAGGIIAMIVGFLFAAANNGYIEEVLLISVGIGLGVFVGLQVLVWVIRGFLKK